MLRKKRIKKNLRKVYSNKAKAIKLLNKVALNSGFRRILDLMFEEELISGWPVEYATIDELIKRYSSFLTNEQLLALKELGYGRE